MFQPRDMSVREQFYFSTQARPPSRGDLPQFARSCRRRRSAVVYDPRILRPAKRFHASVEPIESVSESTKHHGILFVAGLLVTAGVPIEAVALCRRAVGKVLHLGTRFRHGGITEAADSDLTDAEIRAQSPHRSAKVLPRYAKRAMKQVAAGAKKRGTTRSQSSV